MDTSSIKFRNTMMKVRKFKRAIILLFTLLILIGFIFIPNKNDVLIISLLVLWGGLSISYFFNNIKQIILFQHIRELNKMDYTAFEILEKTKEDADIQVMLGKGYKNLLSGLYKIEESIYHSVIRVKQSEDMTNKVITDVAKNLSNPVESINNNLDNLKGDNLSIHVLDKIEDEAHKLKDTINELFELSKVYTRSIELKIENIDISSLIKQSLIEYDSKIKEANLTIKTNIQNEKVFIDADGEKLWRVFEILLDNIKKYSKENTRVYVDLNKDGDRVDISLMNISKKELNTSSNEFFKNINKEGCLGLQIAKNLIEAQRGKLEIFIDGDMFKVNISFDIDYNSTKGEEKIC